MAHLMQFALEAGLEKEFNEKKEDKGTRWVKILIKDEKLVGAGSGAASGDAKKDIADLVKTMASDDEPFYAAVRGTDDCEWIVVAYVPDTSKVKARMQYASTLGHLKKSLGPCVIGDCKASLKEEVTWECVEEAVAKKKGRVDNSDAMTEAEREREEQGAVAEKEARSAVLPGSGGAGAHAIKFPMDDAAKAALEKVSKGDAAGCTIKNESEKLQHDETFEPSAKLADIVKTLGKESRYIIFNHTHDDKSATVFIYFASDQCPVKKRMHYASSKSSVADYATDSGCKIVKTVEFTDPADITTAALDDALKPADPAEEDTAEKRIKPKAPGRGGMRMLI